MEELKPFHYGQRRIACTKTSYLYEDDLKETNQEPITKYRTDLQKDPQEEYIWKPKFCIRTAMVHTILSLIASGEELEEEEMYHVMLELQELEYFLEEEEERRRNQRLKYQKYQKNEKEVFLKTRDICSIFTKKNSGSTFSKYSLANYEEISQIKSSDALEEEEDQKITESIINPIQDEEWKKITLKEDLQDKTMGEVNEYSENFKLDQPSQTFRELQEIPFPLKKIL